MVAITANATATAATTNLVVCSDTIPAGSAVVQEVFTLEGWYRFVHTAASTPTLALELLINGAVICSCTVTPPSTANTYTGKVQAAFTVRAIGPAGSVSAAVMLDGSATTAAHQFGGSNVDDAVDAVNFDLDRSVQLRMRMSTVVASNTLTVTQGYMRRTQH